MKKTVGIDYSADRLISMAADYVEEHDYIKALKMLNKNAVLNGNDEDAYMLYAEIFDDLELNEKCINGWFKYLDCAGDGANIIEAYEALAVAFINIGREEFSAYYYNKLLKSSDTTLTPQGRQDIIDAFLKRGIGGMRTVWPPKAADYSLEMESGIELMRANKFDSAIEKFEQIKEGSDSYNLARNYIAMCNIINDKYDEAEKECLNVLKSNPNDVFALTNISAALGQQHRFDEAKEYTNRLLAIETDKEEDLYKIATVCCENKMHEEAYTIFNKIGGTDIYDSNFLFFKGIAAYNSNHIEESFETFDKLLTIYPNAVTAFYWSSVIHEEAKKPVEERQELEYYYRLPKDEFEANVALLKAFIKLSDKAARQVVEEEPGIITAIYWCFDEGETNADAQLKMLGACAAIIGGLDDLVRDILLDCFVPERVKMEVLGTLIQKNNGGEYNMVLFNLFRKVSARPIKIGRKKRRIFLEAYGMAFSQFAIIKEHQGIMIASALEGVYEKFEAANKLDDIKSSDELAAFIACFAEVKGFLTKEMVCKTFGAKLQKVDKLLEEYTAMVGVEDEDENI